ncbi:uncharacterized protein EV422DRAFT_620572 [Fimicolochytrium jonesii]|uniref:uncharacterized protein n=1 Tax=Fimicolochytrium jonesii TaxID=1396493 RepID=UPI0022FDDD9C|nr:uncharacterized protein EV422DRAFT_620572 [Fimicolochytrium jonesii]KAI8820177.1 hypothetical protein EV422DRAFT_620572 [Fimicolochytrium jonesii]
MFVRSIVCPHRLVPLQTLIASSFYLPPDPPSNDALSAFLQWCASKGFTQHKLVVAEFAETGRGMRAAGDILIAIPATLLLTSTTPDVLSACQPYTSAASLSEHAALAVFLAVERAKGAASAYKPYVDVLPEAFGSVPAVGVGRMGEGWGAWVPEGVRDATQRIRKKVRDDYALVMGLCLRCVEDHTRGDPPIQCTSCPTTPAAPYIPFAAFQWAWFAVNTRCVSLTSLPATPQKRSTPSASPAKPLTTHLWPPHLRACKIALAPMLDFLNHGKDAKVEAGYSTNSSSSSSSSPDSEGYKIRTLVAYPANTEVFISYGAHSNEFLLAEYGFAIPGNECNFLTVDEGVWEVGFEGETGEGRERARAVVEGVGLGREHTLHPHGEPSPRLLALLRIRLLLVTTPNPLPPSAIDACWMELAPDLERRVRRAVWGICGRGLDDARRSLAGLDGQGEEVGAGDLGDLSEELRELVRLVWTDAVGIFERTMEWVREEDRAAGVH